MKIFTIIVTYNGMKWLKRCLDSLRSSTMPTIPVVIDNNSTDGSVSFVKENYPEAIVFQQDKNLGFGQANNVGIRYAMDNGADFVMLLNQDASIKADAIQLLVNASDGLSMLSPMQLNGDGSRLDKHFKKSLLDSDNGWVDDVAVSKCKARYKTNEVCAACWFMPRALIEKIGGFNPLFFHYGEDNNFLQRLDYHNISTFVIPHAFMCHDRENVFGNKKAFYRKWVYRNMISIATDINLSFLARLKSNLLLVKNLYFAKMSRGHYIPGMFLINQIKILLLTEKIRYSRKQEIQTKQNWL